MFTSNSDVPEKSLHMKQDGKFFSKLLTREANNNPSFRVYNGGVVGSVPFMWESRPGTPKNKLCENSLRPLTPPPSYHYFDSNKKPIKKNSRSSLLYSLFPRINLRRNRKSNVFSTRTNPLSSSSLSSNSSSSFALSNSRYCDERSSVSSFHSVADCEEVQSGSPRSVLCFGLNRGFVCHFGGCKKW
ncbi:hypothetical protein HS088_TW05G00392 [Tripterygium wilfordii]|uniref:Uncharacterized protein n=2 Tax=Tripterygium wilfordii TaxID=458696 RepID=A0A7J7DMS9_TRIWF|nr:hypothetical protein HS088_TW05G00392 [Tripterygium wilfordii]